MLSAINERSITVFTVPFDAIDAGNAAEFRSLIVDMFADEAKIVVDLSACEYIDSAGLGAIVWAVRRLHEFKGDLRICGVRKPVRALFELVRMNKLVSVFELQQEAIDSFAS